MDVIYTIVSWLNAFMPVWVLISSLFLLYLMSFGIGHILKRMRESGESEIKIIVASVAVWVPILIVASALIKL